MAEQETTFEEWARRVMRYPDAKGIPRDEGTRSRFLADNMPWSIAEELWLRFCEGMAAYMLGRETPADPVAADGYAMMDKDDDRWTPIPTPTVD